MKDLYLIDQIEVAPSLLHGVDFNRSIKDNEQSLRLVKNSNYEKGKKYILNIDAPVSHGMRLTLNNAVYLPTRLKNSAKSFYTPYKKPIIKEHITGAGLLGNPAPDAIGRVAFAQYADFRHSNSSQLTFEESIAQVQRMMEDGTIYNSEFGGLGAVYAKLKILDQDSIEKFLDERILNFSVGGRTREVYSPFNGKHVADLTDEDLSPYDEKDGMRGFKVVGDINYDELSATLTPADTLASVTNMELQEFHISDSVAESYRNKINSNNKTYFVVDGLINLEGEKQMDQNQYNIKDFCGPDNTYPVTSKEEGQRALQELNDSDHSESMKTIIKQAINLKLKGFDKKEKTAFLDKETLKDSLSKLNTFDMINFLVNLKDSLYDSLDKETVKNLLELKDAEDKGSEIVFAELKDAKTKLQAQSAEIADLNSKLVKSQKSFVFLAKAIKDNTELTTLEDLAEVSELEKTFDELLKDSVLFDKLSKIFAGTDPNARVEDSILESDVANNAGAEDQPVELSDQVKIFRGMFNDKKVQDGEFAAQRWLKNLKDSKYISDEDFNLITKES